MSKKSAGLHTHTHTLTWDLLLGWIGSWEMLEVVISVPLEQSLGRDMSFNTDFHMLILFMLLMFMPFAWGQAKIQVWGSLISQ